MKNRKKKPVFYDHGKRWKKVKKSAFFVMCFATAFVVLVIYAFWYDPFNTIPKERQDLVYEQIEGINNVSRPVIDNGTFITIDDKTYDKPYIKRFGEEKKRVILTFDDGPDPATTPYVLNVLAKEKVKGTFFTVGKQLYRYPTLGKSILAQGSDIGLHTFSHYENERDGKLNWLTFKWELDFTEKIFAYQYGYKSLLFRIPYLGLEDKLSYDALQYIREAYNRNLTISAPTVDAEDWRIKDIQVLTKLATTSEVQTVVILFHDAGGNRKATLQALPEIIKKYKEKKYTFMTISELAKEQGLPYQAPLASSEKVLAGIVFHTYDMYRKAPLLLTDGFFIGLLFVIIHTAVILILALMQDFLKKREHERNKGSLKESKKNLPLVSILIPMYNEEHAIKGTISAILKSTYKHIEIFVIDNGSTDQSVQKVTDLNDKRVHLLTIQKRGKYRALNYGLRHVKGRYTICIDADTRITSSAIKNILTYFTDKKVGAVAGNIRIGNKKNILTRLQIIEYTLAQSIDKRATDLFGVVMIVPGAFGAWKTAALRKIRGFSSQTNAEDFDATLAIIKANYVVKYAHNAHGYTEAPLTMPLLYTQRFRWNFGNLQVFFKYKSMLFQKKFGALGLFFLPRAMLLQIPSIIVTPFVDLFIVLNLLVGERELTFVFLLLYMIMQYAVTAIAYYLMKKPLHEILYIPILRFGYTQILYAIFFISLLYAIRGEIIAWTKLQHTGKVSIAVD